MYGLGAIPQYSIAGYASTVRSHLGISDDTMIVCGVSVGWPSQKVLEEGRFFPGRKSPDSFTTWHSDS